MHPGIRTRLVIIEGGRQSTGERARHSSLPRIRCSSYLAHASDFGPVNPMCVGRLTFILAGNWIVSSAPLGAEAFSPGRRNAERDGRTSKFVCLALMPQLPNLPTLSVVARSGIASGREFGRSPSLP